MTTVLADTSLVIKWFKSDDEDEVVPALALREAHIGAAVTVRLLDLAVYEFSNVLMRRLGWPAAAATEAVDRLLILVGSLVRLDARWIPEALTLAEQHQLSGYDAHWAAAARHLNVPLVSADRLLLEAGLAESPTAAASRLGLLQ